VVNYNPECGIDCHHDQRFIESPVQIT
jgi:hypothetical protein